MRPKLILLFSILFFCRAASQVVFCPPGAKWTADFTNGMWSTSILNSSISYSGDSIIGTDTLKVLTHNKFFNQCNNGSVSTLLKQKGDTIFIKNRHTQDTWQTLFNFACSPGQGWTFTYTLQTLPAQTYSFTVDSSTTIIENGLSLRRQFLSSQSTFAPSYTAHTVVTERYAWGFLFQFQGRISACDGDGFINDLCYSDNEFGTKLFSALPCDYQNPSGVLELEQRQKFQAFPVPCKDILVLANIKQGAIVSLMDLTGRLVLKKQLDSKQEIDLSELQSGIYFLSLVEKNGAQIQVKIVKE